jgi:hypothetical protein
MEVELFNFAGEVITKAPFRAAFELAWREFQQQGSVSFQIPAIDVLILDGEDNVYLTKRVGVPLNTTAFSVIEAGQTSESVLRSAYRFNFSRPITICHNFGYEYETELMKKDTAVMTVAKKMDTVTIPHKRLIGKKMFDFPMLTTMYVGRFDGELELNKGSLVKLPLEQLCKGLAEAPQLFTTSVDQIVGRYLANKDEPRYH